MLSRRSFLRILGLGGAAFACGIKAPALPTEPEYRAEPRGAGWSQTWGPGTATFADATDPATEVTFDAEGLYCLSNSGLRVEQVNPGLYVWSHGESDAPAPYRAPRSPAFAFDFDFEDVQLTDAVHYDAKSVSEIAERIERAIDAARREGRG